jgi:nitroreductase
MSDPIEPAESLRPLRQVRQIRQFTQEPVTDAELDAIVDVGRWSGSSRNSQPWRFVVIRDPGTIASIAELGAPHTRSLSTATAAIAVTMPDDPEHVASLAYDEGRASERLLVAANLLGLGAAISWLPPKLRPTVGDLLGLPQGRVVRTIVALGHPAPEALVPKTPGAPARLPREETVFQEHWPSTGNDTATSRPT